MLHARKPAMRMTVKKSTSQSWPAAKSATRRTADVGKLFYTNVPHMDSLVFAPPKVAEYISAIHHALKAPTWGKFKARIPPEEYKLLLKRVQDGEFDDLDPDDDDYKPFELPSDENPFEPDSWFAVSDGDYPDWLQKR